MSVIHAWVCFILWISFSTQEKTPDIAVTCLLSEDCALPCSFQPGGNETIEWFKQDVVVFKFERNGDKEEHEQLAGPASIFPPLVSLGNATLTIRRTGLEDRGTYRCHVTTSKGEHNAKVIVKVEAPIQALSLELSRLSGYEEMKCTVHNVFPAPRVTWGTEPPTFEDLRPVTRMLADKHGLYMVDSRLKRLNGQPDLVYICKVTTSYGGPAWTTSLRVREIRGTQGRDLTLPCYAPPHLNNPLLHWSFSSGEDPSHILTYDSQSGNSVSSPTWGNHVELDGFRVPFGDGSLRLMDPQHSEHTGSYTCVFSVPHSTHTERNEVTIDDLAGERSVSEAPSYWWVAGLVITVLVLALVGVLVYRKVKGSTSNPRKDPEEAAELRLVSNAAAGSNLHESSPLTVGGTNGQSGIQTGTQLC